MPLHRRRRSRVVVIGRELTGALELQLVFNVGQRLRLFAKCPYGKHQLADPDGSFDGSILDRGKVRPLLNGTTVSET